MKANFLDDNSIEWWGTGKTLEDAQYILYNRCAEFIICYPCSVRIRAVENTELILEHKNGDGTVTKVWKCTIVSYSLVYSSTEPKISETYHAVDPLGLYPNSVASADRALKACLVARHSYNNQIKYMGYDPMVFKSFKIRIAVDGSAEFSFSGVAPTLTAESEVVFGNSAEPLCGHVHVNSDEAGRRVFVKLNRSEFSRVIAVRGSKAYDLSKLDEARDFVNCLVVKEKFDFPVEYFME